MSDLEFHVGDQVFATFGEALAASGAKAAETQSTVNLDVCVWSKAGARAWGGTEAVRSYEEDPEASVLERFAVRVTSQGRIP